MAKILVTEKRLLTVLDDILRQVVCDCGGYRHHGVGWMPEGSGEGKTVAVQLLKNMLREHGHYND